MSSALHASPESGPSGFYTVGLLAWYSSVFCDGVTGIQSRLFGPALFSHLDAESLTHSVLLQNDRQAVGMGRERGQPRAPHTVSIHNGH